MTRLPQLRRPMQSTEAEMAFQHASVRILLEQHAAPEAALHASDPETLQQMLFLAQSEDPEAGLRFHSLLVVGAGNDALAAVFDDVLARLYAIGGEEAICGARSTAAHEHGAIMRAILAGQRDSAAEAMRAHHASAHAALLEMFTPPPALVVVSA